jgi:hypothetical protein
MVKVKRRLVLAAPGVAALALVGGLAFGQVGAAQDATPAGMGMDHNHPGHIHSGTCDELGDVVFPLENATAGGTMGMMSTPMAGMDAMATPAMGMAGGEVVAESVSTVEASLDDILAAEHAINFHESEENIQNYIACGDITGTADGGRLEVTLEELNDSGYEGQALLEDNGDGTTQVTVQLMSTDSAMMATPEA